jgi:uncharacterized MAPEG superfamily protein
MTSELLILTWLVALTAICWVPYIINRVTVRGLIDAVGYPENAKPESAWAIRMKAAHYNAVENLVVFAALVLIANAANITNEITVVACQTYFWARVVHYLAYTFAIPWVRTLSFAVGFVAQLALVVQIL